MQRIGVLNGNNITYDHDLAGLVRGLTDSGVIQGGKITGNKVQPVQAVIACQRSNGQKLMLYFESDEQVAIPSSGTFKVYIEVEQSKIDDGTGNAENGTGIASIKTGPTLPSQNFLLLASVADGQITDERNLIPKIQQIKQTLDTFATKFNEAAPGLAQLSSLPSMLQDIASLQQSENLRKGEPIAINQTISGSATGTWTAPSNGFLEVSYVTGGRGDSGYDISYAMVNNKKLTSSTTVGLGGSVKSYGYEWIFVKKGTVNLSTRYASYSGTQPSLTLLSFIPL